MKQPDKLFRDKFQDYRPDLSPEAWGRVEQHLRPNTRSTGWLKVAAAAILVAVAAGLVFRFQRNTADSFVAATVHPAPDTAAQKRSTELKPEKSDATPSYQERTNAPAQKDVSNGPRKSRPAPASAPSRKTEAVTIEEPLAGGDMIAELPEPLEEPQAETAAAEKHVTIVLTASEVNEKYLTKKGAGDATAEEKEASTLQKLLDKAYDLKHHEGAIGSLRQKKDEILAMDFRNEKRHENQ